MFRTRSTVELRGVDRTFRLARSAGFVKGAQFFPDRGPAAIPPGG